MFLNFSISALSSVSCCVFSASKDLFPQIHEVLLTDFDVRFLPRRRAESYESLTLSNPIFQRSGSKKFSEVCGMEVVACDGKKKATLWKEGLEKTTEED